MFEQVDPRLEELSHDPLIDRVTDGIMFHERGVCLTHMLEISDFMAKSGLVHADLDTLCTINVVRRYGDIDNGEA